MVDKRKVSNPLGLAVLAWLLLEPMHPYELGRRLTETDKDRNIKFNRSSLYMVVSQLHKAGFVMEQETVRNSQRPERTVYAITEEGRTELYDWLRELVAHPHEEYPQFGVALSLLSVLNPTEAVGLLRERLIAMDEQAAEIGSRIERASGEGVDWVFLVEEHYRRALLRAERDFVADLIESLDRPEYIRQWKEFFGSRK